MRNFVIILIALCLTNQIFAIEIKEKITRTPVTSLPFSKGKTVFCAKSSWAFTDEQTVNLPMFMYQDLGLMEKYNDSNATCILCHKFQVNENFNLVALDISVAEWGKQLLATYRNGELVDCIEADVNWYVDGPLCIKQWQIDASQEIIVTWLKIESSTPILAFSNFDKIKAQRIDTHYKVDTNGKFQEVKQVKYRSQTYTKAYLIDKNKNLWDGNEIPINN